MLNFIKKIITRVKYRFKRVIVKIRKHRKEVSEKQIRKLMNAEQKKVFELIETIAKQKPEAIRYVKFENETLIIVEDVTITLKKNGKVYIDNHTGFHSQWFSDTAFALLNSIVDTEAHRYRRKLKYEAKRNRIRFLQSIVGKQ